VRVPATQHNELWRLTQHAACYFTMLMEGDRVEAAKMSPSSCWPGLSVFRLGMDNLLAPADSVVGPRAT